MKELRKNKHISLKKLDYILLYLANKLGCCFLNRLWLKKKKLQKLYQESADRIESKLNIIKIAKHQTDVKVLLKHSMLDEAMQY